MKKNTTPTERILRVLVGLLTACAAVLLLGPPYSYLVAATGIVLALTGLVGYCPMCHAAGRKPVE